jgi:galactose oxidase
VQGRDFRRACSIAIAAVLLLGGQDRPDPGTGPQAAARHHGGQPIQLEYACGNRFVVTNGGPEAVSVTFRVAGTKEEGSARVEAAPAEDPHFSEALIETKGRGTVELYRDGQQVGSRENGGVPCVPVASAAAPAAAPAQAGAWTAPFSWPVVAVHLHLLPNGRVLSWGSPGSPEDPRPEGDLPRVWNPATGGFTASPVADFLFCAGHTFLPDGRLFVAGGHIAASDGLRDINLYSSGAGWVSGSPMQRGRWYPTTTMMGNGRVVILAGREKGIDVPVVEVWASGSLRILGNANLTLPMYPRTFLAPNGLLFYAGEARTTRYLNPAGAGTWTTVGSRRVANRNYGSAVMYEPGKILYAGGGYTTNTAEVINLNQAAPAWKATGSMAFARRHLNLTVLPTGEVLATGGVGGSTFNDLTRPARAAEIWNPATGTWRTLASSAVTRGYHANSILLPDGRVLHTGSGDGEGAPRQLNAELYSPPYLFAGPRPTIGSAPGSVRYGTTFRVTTPNAAAIVKVSLIRLGSATHSFDMNQRFQTLSFTKDATGLTVTAPTIRNRTPPGHYMLFILNGSGVPSVAKIVQVR